jgi:thiamine-monophosphate kinase
MGASPSWVLLALALPSADAAWLEPFSAGFFALAERYGVELVGGDTTRAPLRTITVTAIGEVPAGMALLRAGARPGDDIWVSGELGSAALGLARPHIAAAAARLHRPEPRVDLGERLRGLAHAAIDVSDGLTSDLGHILERSQVGAVVHYAKLPRSSAFSTIQNREFEENCVLSGGDDYELAFTAALERRTEVEALSADLDLPLARIGTIQAGEPRLVVLDERHRPMDYRRGFDHFPPA